MNDPVYILSILADLAFGTIASIRKKSLLPILFTIVLIVIVEKYVNPS